MKLTDGEALTSAAASHYHHPTMALVLKHNMPAIMLKLRMSSPRYRYPYIICWGVYFRISGSPFKCPFQSGIVTLSYIRKPPTKVPLTAAFLKNSIGKMLISGNENLCITKISSPGLKMAGSRSRSRSRSPAYARRSPERRSRTPRSRSRSVSRDRRVRTSLLCFTFLVGEVRRLSFSILTGLGDIYSLMYLF